MKLKEILGFCAIKGCKQRHSYEATITTSNKITGKKYKKKVRLCADCLCSIAQHGTLKSITALVEIECGRE